MADLDEFKHAWSRAEIRLGTSLRFERTPDVAEDRRLSYGTARISRSGPTGSALNLSIRAAYPEHTVRPATAFPSAGADFELRTSSGVLIVPDEENQRWPVTILAGASEVALRVQPKAGTEDVREYEAAYLDICDSDDGSFAIAPRAPGATGYHGPPSYPNPGRTVAVTFWDGPN